ncbi:MAG TPA: ABC transporter permease subunit [Verrucomicrobiae bacterium]|nr:ABC transporter permease subunit [Verrucomicrobiae bacterium]
MRGLYAVYRKEMIHYFVSPVAYVVVCIFLVLSGVFFNSILSDVIRYSYEAGMQSMQMGGGAFNVDVPSMVLRGFLGLLGTIILFLTPMLTMGVYSEERKRGTMELLMTSPITDAQIVIGKFLASFTLLVIMLIPTVFYVIFMFGHADPAPPWRMIAGGYLGVLLLGAMLLALGSFLSSLTENQIISAVLIFGISLLLWLLDIFSQNGSDKFAQTLHYAAVLQHYDPFVRGVVDTTGLVFFGTWIFFGIFLTMRSIESMRWRRA